MTFSDSTMEWPQMNWSNESCYCDTMGSIVYKSSHDLTQFNPKMKRGEEIK